MDAKQRTTFGRLLLLAVALGVLILAAVMVRSLPTKTLADHWRRQLATVPDAQAPAQLRRIAQLGDEGIEILVEALGSRRQAVAVAARDVLQAQVDSWQPLKIDVRTRKSRLLVDSLARHCQRFDPAARQFAQQLLTQVLWWPSDSNVVPRHTLLAAAEQVLQSTAPGSSPSATAPIDASHADGGPVASREPPPVRIEGLAQIPGGGLAPDPLANGPIAQPPLLADTAGTARPLVEAGAAPNSGDGSTDSPDPRAPTSDNNQPKRIAREDEPSARRLSDSQTPAGDPSRPPLAHLPAIDVMRRLHAAGQQPELARQELIRRGFGPQELSLAGQMTDPDPRVRRALVDRLPQLGAVDAGRWLLWLSYDQDRQVRLAALSLLATSSDPRLHRRLGQAAREDDDPQVRQAAEEWLRKRR